MKKKYLILLILVAFFAACTDKFEDYNLDRKNPAKVAGEALFSNAEKSLVDHMSSTNVNVNVFKLFSQYWTETTYTDEANYDLINRNIPQQVFRDFYRGFLRDFQEADKLITETGFTSPVGQVEMENKLAIIELLVCYSYQQLVDIFGDVPYSEAMNIDNISPKYDKASEIYSDLINRVKAAVAALDDSQGSFGSADFVYDGDVASWKKFGNSLLVKLGIGIADFDATLAKSTIEGAYAGAFTSGGDDALFPYQTASPNYNPIYDDLVASGRNDFVAANTIVDYMNDLDDPRRPAYFDEVEGGGFVGGIYGTLSAYSLYSHLSAAIHDPTFPGMLLTYDQLLFYLAEAAARNFSVGATAEELYADAITASFDFWGVSADAAGYLANPDVAWATAAGDWKQKIGTQAWIAFYTRGLEGFTSWRRLDFPILNMPESITQYNEIPKRYTYPVNEQTLNKASWEAASTSIGGDDMTTPLFWDTEQPVPVK